MRRLLLSALTVAITILVALPVAAGDTFVVMQGQGGLMKSPARYTGTFLSGYTGSWEFTIDDTGWPAETDSTARFDHIWSEFFADNYDDSPGSEAWYGEISSNMPKAPTFSMSLSSPPGYLGGNISLTIMVLDKVPDGILSQSEKHSPHNLTAMLVVNPRLGGDEYDNTCGQAALGSGTFNFVNPPTNDMIYVNGLFQTFTCPSAVEESTWGAIKSLYE